MRRSLLALLLLSVAGAGTASANAEMLTPGVAVPLPGKRRLPKRTNHTHLALSGSLLAGDAYGAEAAGEIRLMEAFGIGLGATATDGASSMFIRMTPMGLAINNWGFLGYADYHFDDRWSLGTAMVVPIRRGGNDYLRISVSSDLDERTTFGIGLERDVW